MSLISTYKRLEEYINTPTIYAINPRISRFQCCILRIESPKRNQSLLTFQMNIRVIIELVCIFSMLKIKQLFNLKNEIKWK